MAPDRAILYICFLSLSLSLSEPRMAKVAPQAHKYPQRWPARNLGCATMFAADFYLDFWAGTVDWIARVLERIKRLQEMM
jgi:hypothetical protein